MLLRLSRKSSNTFSCLQLPFLFKLANSLLDEAFAAACFTSRHAFGRSETLEIDEGLERFILG